jgi:hypothetical protein
MRKVSAVHFLEINRLMLKTTERYINCFVDKDADISSIKMYTDDVAHNIAALSVFNANKDASVLHDSVMYQDTLVREFYYTVLKYIEDNKLIESHAYTCS